MCLAIPGRVIERNANDAVVDLQGNRLHIAATLTPDVQPGQWVLVHAGFAITILCEADALEIWDYLRRDDRTTVLSDAGAEHPHDSGANDAQP